MSNHQGDAINRQAAQAATERIQQAENARINAENAAAARRAASAS